MVLGMVRAIHNMVIGRGSVHVIILHGISFRQVKPAESPRLNQSVQLARWLAVLSQYAPK
jgi:hypothetical protein